MYCNRVENIIEIQDEKNLNFENEDSKVHREMAKEDLQVAKELQKASQRYAYPQDRKVKRAINRKAVQISQEAVEHAQKSILAAGEDFLFENKNTRKKLENTHNNSFLQRELEKKGLSIIDSSDVSMVCNLVNKQDQKSPYNAVRYIPQNISDESVEAVIGVVQKAVDNLDEMVRKSNRIEIRIGECIISVDEII